MYRVFKVEIGSEGFDEQIGSKEKYWIEHPDLGKCLFKYSRPDTGEHWAEKVACVIARELFLPHAQYELARYGQRWGIVSPSFTPEGYSLVHANELLAALFPDYDPGAKGRRNKHYTVKSASELLDRIDVPYPHLVDPPSLVTSADWFTGYLLLDALIGNTDRHAENWGALRSNIWSPALLLAPTFDHASSLGRELRQGRLGVDSVQAYAQRARSALFATPEDQESAQSLRGILALRRRSSTRRSLLARAIARHLGTRVQQIHRLAPSRFLLRALGRFRESDLAAQ